MYVRNNLLFNKIISGEPKSRQWHHEILILVKMCMKNGYLKWNLRICRIEAALKSDP